MKQKLGRYTSPLVRYKKNMARIVWDERSNYFSDYGKRIVKDIFRRFDKEWHDIIADEYPALVHQYMNSADTAKYNEWREWTQHLEDESEKRSWWLDVEQVESYLKHFHSWPDGNRSIP